MKNVVFKQTSRERPKSAPYLRLKNTKRLQNVKVLVNWGPVYKKILKKVSMPKKTERGDPLGFFNIHFVGKYQKMEGLTLRREKKFEKVSQGRKYFKGVPFGRVEMM